MTVLIRIAYIVLLVFSAKSVLSCEAADQARRMIQKQLDTYIQYKKDLSPTGSYNPSDPQVLQYKRMLDQVDDNAFCPEMPSSADNQNRSGRNSLPTPPNRSQNNPWASLDGNGVSGSSNNPWGQQTKGSSSRTGSGDSDRQDNNPFASVKKRNGNTQDDNSNSDQGNKDKQRKSPASAGNSEDDGEDYTGRPCFYFTKPPVENETRINSYSDGALICYQGSAYYCENRHWRKKGPCKLFNGITDAESSE